MKTGIPKVGETLIKFMIQKGPLTEAEALKWTASTNLKNNINKFIMSGVIGLPKYGLAAAIALSPGKTFAASTIIGVTSFKDAFTFKENDIVTFQITVTATTLLHSDTGTTTSVNMTVERGDEKIIQTLNSN